MNVNYDFKARGLVVVVCVATTGTGQAEKAGVYLWVFYARRGMKIPQIDQKIKFKEWPTTLLLALL